MWALLTVLLVALWVLLFLKQLWCSRHYPPGPLPLPLLGGTWRTGFRCHEGFFMQLAKRYGKICTLWVGHQPLVVLSGFQAVKDGLLKHAEDFSERALSPFAKVAGQEMGIIFSNGHTWKQQRRFGVVTMRKLGLGRKGMERQIEEEARQLVETLAQAKGRPLDPSWPITNAVSNVICALTFGHRFCLDDEKFQKLVEAVDGLARFAGTVFETLYDIFPWMLDLLPGPHKRVFSAIEKALSHAKEEIQSHREHQCLHDPQDFIDFYLLQMEKRRNDSSSTFDEENLAQCIHDFFTAGTETTTTALKWALLLLANHPDIQEKIHREIQDVFASSCSICYEDKRMLPYTNAVIHEILRLKYPLFFGLPRQTTKAVSLSGIPIPKGAHIIADLRSVLQDPEHWETPHEFNPNHFLDKDGNFVAREEFLPFGAGARACLGEQLARMELFLFLTSLLRAFQFQPPEGVERLSQEPVMQFTCHPRPYQIRAIPRCTQQRG